MWYVRDNLIAAAKGLYIGASREGIDVTSETINTYETIIDVDTRVWTSETIEQLQKLWKDPGIKKVWRCYKLKYHLLWCTNYLFKHAGRIGSSNYRPTEDDIFRARLKTTGAKLFALQNFFCVFFSNLLCLSKARAGTSVFLWCAHHNILRGFSNFLILAVAI